MGNYRLWDKGGNDVVGIGGVGFGWDTDGGPGSGLDRGDGGYGWDRDCDCDGRLLKWVRYSSKHKLRYRD